MALPAYSADIQAPSDRLHYFHPFRIAIAALAIIAADLGLTFWASGGHSSSLTARTSLLAVLLLAAVGRTFQPRTLSADAAEIRWKKVLQPAQTVPRHEVAAIQYLTTARPGGPRYYFVNRDGNAVLWVDRFTPARMGSFASYLGIPLRPVSAAPLTSAGADAAVKANAIIGGRRAGMIPLGAIAVLMLAATVGAVLWVRHDGAELAAYERAPLCEQPAADPLACRFDLPAVVTAINANGRIDIRFPTVPPAFPYRTTWVRIVNGAVPEPGFGKGDMVQIEVFDHRTMAINDATTDGFTTLQSNASWFVVAGTGFFLVVSLIGFVAFWKGPSPWIVAATPQVAAPSKPSLDDAPTVSDQPGPKEKPAAIERVPVPYLDAELSDGWPTLVEVPGFDLARVDPDMIASGILGSGERLLARATVNYYLVPNTSSILLLTDRRLLIVGRKRMEIPRTRITLIAYWTVKDSIAVTYRTMDGAHGILVTGPQLVLTGGPKTDMHRLFEAMRIALTNPDAIRTPVVIMRSPGRLGRSMQAVGRVSHRVWLAWVG
jgi:hypothetical protein